MNDQPNDKQLSDNEIVRRFVEQAQDDRVREDAIFSLRELVDDYEEAMLLNAGDLGGTELV